MDIWDADKLVLFIAFVVPGFISLKTYALLQPTDIKDTSQQLIDAVAYSCINYSLMLAPIYAVEQSTLKLCYPALYVAFYVVVLLIAPICWAWGFLWLRKTQLFQRSIVHPTGKPWDFVFSQRIRYWVIATLADGRQVAGRYDRRSFASSTPAPEQIYLEEAWVLSEGGGFERPREGTAGIIILAKEIVTLELFKVEEQEELQDEQQQEQQG
ncbi:DUF6338 family protein [Pseudomonas nicosulfuronedens]|uniref:DUF6338 family protein n=1 Tax=Pseudomonas nicosulfuronedens TaxID=2571105 RepID=UPI002446AA5A|nr:DUF6338 family protein [Pseudomonas nicosulfuronedens]MDH1012477.1 DUF6338 family protein [Pseudomonas nicosulfuronedens]MDH1979982.1 DUF6338 family protein [Pseudomonas nicosulfuronedens]MDH2029920.1 DUF6338 family protein [Pseudomonas nicosulfuronedens]